MSLANWLAEGADPARMTPEEVRREQNLLNAREEQAIARLESLASDQGSLVERGADTPSDALRRALARRHARLGAEVAELDRELARVGKELAGLRAIRNLLRDGTALAAPGDCAPLLVMLDDTDATEIEFAEQLASSLRAGQVSGRVTQEIEFGPDLMKLWERMDRGEIASARDALRRPDREGT